MEYREAIYSDIGGAAQLLTRAFFDYPTFVSLFNDQFRKTSGYEKFLDDYFVMELLIFWKKGKIVVAEEQGKIVGVGILESSKVKKGLWNYIRWGGCRLIIPYLLHRRMPGLGIKLTNERITVLNGMWSLSYLAVDTNFRGQGVGTQLLKQEILPLVQKNRGKKLMTVANTQESIRYYRSQHFEVVKRHRNTGEGFNFPNWQLVRNVSEL